MNLKFSAAAFLALVVMLTTGAACSPSGTSAPQGTEAAVSQTLTLAESSATAAVIIATNLSKTHVITGDDLQRVIDADKVVDAAVKTGFAALNVHDVPTALAAFNSDVVQADIKQLQTFIASRKTGASP